MRKYLLPFLIVCFWSCENEVIEDEISYSDIAGYWKEFEYSNDGGLTWNSRSDEDALILILHDSTFNSDRPTRLMHVIESNLDDYGNLSYTMHGYSYAICDNIIHYSFSFLETINQYIFDNNCPCDGVNYDSHSSFGDPGSFFLQLTGSGNMIFNQCTNPNGVDNYKFYRIEGFEMP